MDKKIDALEKKIGYSFKDRGLCEQALRHSSYVNERRMKKADCNERLEFLGDAVLELASSQFLYASYPQEPEGTLTKKRASMVCEQALAYTAKEMGLGEYLLLGKGEDMAGGRTKDSITSDAVEALIGAIYLDGGFDSARRFITDFVLNDLEHKQLFYDSKTMLQELVQSKIQQPLTYELLSEKGPDHQKSFCVEVRIGGKSYERATGHTKKAAEQQAAYQTLLSLREKYGR